MGNMKIHLEIVRYRYGRDRQRYIERYGEI